MFYYVFKYLQEQFNLLGAGLFQYISFRALVAAALAISLTTLIGKKLIPYLQKKQVGESIRNLGLEGEKSKKGTPTMGGILIILSVIIPVILFAKITNIYVIISVIAFLWMGLIGFLDDYIKIFKKNKSGLKGKFKILGQVTLGIIVGSILYFSPEVKVREYYKTSEKENIEAVVAEKRYEDKKASKTTIPFFKKNELDYANLLPFESDILVGIFYIIIVTLIVTAVSNGANITDGLDGLSAGTSAIVIVALAVLAYVSGNFILADYLNIMYLPNIGEVVVVSSALAGACIGFLWFNSYPAQIFMGDTGSLSLGAVIAVLALCIRKELLLPILCGVFFIENLSVILQVSYFKYTRKKYGEGRRIFKMSPLHHHYQKLGIPESKIVTRFWIVGLLLALASVVTLKIR